MLTTLKSITKVNTGVNLVYINYDSTDGELDIFKDLGIMPKFTRIVYFYLFLQNKKIFFSCETICLR